MLSSTRLTTEEIEKALQSIANKYDASKILLNITGGEPLVRKDLFEVMRFAKKLGYYWGMTTNAILINDENIEKMKEFKIDSWRIVNMNPIGRAQDNSELALGKEDYKYLLEFIKEKKKKSKFEVTYGCTHFVGMKYEKEVRNHMFFCVTGFTTGSILYNGDIYVCPSVERRKDFNCRKICNPNCIICYRIIRSFK